MDKDDESRDLPDSVIAHARKKRFGLRMRLRQFDEFKEYERLTKFIETHDALVAEQAEQRQGRRASNPKLLDFVETLLRSAGRPLSVREITARTEQAGIEVGGVQPTRNLSVRLSTDARFRAMEDGSGWTLVDMGTI